MTAGNGAGNPEALREEIMQTRAELGETVQALAARADVKTRLKESAVQKKDRLVRRAAEKTGMVRGQAAEAKGMVREQAAEAKGMVREQAAEATGMVRQQAGQGAAAVRRKPLPLAALAAGAVAIVLAVLVIRGRSR